MDELNGAIAALGSRPLGKRGPQVTALGLGCAPLGNLYRAISDDDATAVVDAAWNAGIRVFDTAPLYGNGLAEVRVGAALKDIGAARERIVIGTKVGWIPGALGGDHFTDGVRSYTVMFETDYPHPTCLYPDSLPIAARAVQALPDESRRRVLSDNAMALYRIPAPGATPAPEASR